MSGQERRPLNHSRRVAYDSFERPDGRYDIEGTLRDSKGYIYPDRERGDLTVGEPVHDIFACITITPDYMVEGFYHEMRAVPFSYCHSAVDPERLIGASIRQGWRRSLDAAFGPHRGCSHLRELVFGMGTIAFQTLSALADTRRLAAGIQDSDVEKRPFFIGGCHSWAEDSPVTRRWYPQFAVPKIGIDPEG